MDYKIRLSNVIRISNVTMLQVLAPSVPGLRGLFRGPSRDLTPRLALDCLEAARPRLSRSMALTFPGANPLSTAASGPPAEEDLGPRRADPWWRPRLGRTATIGGRRIRGRTRSRISRIVDFKFFQVRCKLAAEATPGPPSTSPTTCCPTWRGTRSRPSRRSPRTP